MKPALRLQCLLTKRLTSYRFYGCCNTLTLKLVKQKIGNVTKLSRNNRETAINWLLACIRTTGTIQIALLFSWGVWSPHSVHSNQTSELLKTDINSKNQTCPPLHTNNKLLIFRGDIKVCFNISEDSCLRANEFIYILVIHLFWLL